jgi:DNA-3-methyladenine glycosylase I
MTEKPKTYCDAVLLMDRNNVHRIYHDTAYGYPITDDNELFGRLILEINQAGLSWTTILNKQENFRAAYHNFEINKVANYDENDRQRLLNDTGIIRNRLKINATIHNARVILDLQQKHGSFKHWLDANHANSKENWVKVFKKTFLFTGGEIVNEFLMSTGYLPGAHTENCPVYHKLKANFK